MVHMKKLISLLVALALLTAMVVSASSAQASYYTPWKITGSCSKDPCSQHTVDVIVQAGDVVYITASCPDNPPTSYDSGLTINVIRNSGVYFWAWYLNNPQPGHPQSAHSQAFNNAQTVKVQYQASAGQGDVGSCNWSIAIH